MEVNRNQYFLFGLIVLMLGIQFRWVDSLVLNEPTTRFLAARFSSTAAQVGRTLPQLAGGPAPRKVIRPPDWLGWAMLSVGSVLILHSLAMKRPE